MQSQFSQELRDICFNIPKAELHVHLEGTFEPELMIKIAQRNNIILPYNKEQIQMKYDFQNLGEFLDVYYEACSVLLYKQDFCDLAYEYLQRSSAQGLKYVELFFDPQTHLKRNVTFETIISGIVQGILEGQNQFGIKSNLIMCFLRDLSEENAIEVFKVAKEYKQSIIGIGLDSYEVNNPPTKFQNVFKLAKENGFNLCAHAGEEGTCQNIIDSLDILNCSRIDHGCVLIQDQDLIKQFAENQIPLTMCPLSNKKLQVTPDLSKHMLMDLFNQGVLVTINSDDPAFFGGYIGENYYQIALALNISVQNIISLAKNSFRATWLTKDEQEKYVKLVNDYVKQIQI